MANTTFSPTDKVVGITLTGGNLIATNNNNVISGVRAIDRQVTGKFYFEYLCTPFAGSGGVGLATSAFDLTLNPNNFGAGTCYVRSNGNIYAEGVLIGAIAAIAGGTVCIAVDCSARLIWFRLGAAGLWNNSATASPTTGIGGLSMGLGGGIAAYPFISLFNLNDKVTANFGTTAFTGAVPVGFTSGFTSGATPPLNMLDTQAAVEDWRTPANPDMRATQVSVEDWREPIPNVNVTQASLEHWLAPLPDVQLTQALLEQWASVSSGNLQGIVTQVVFEHWASVASVSPAAGGPLVTMIH